MTPTLLSDHHPISVHISFAKSPSYSITNNPRFILNNSLLLDEDILSAIHLIRIINQNSLLSLSPIDIWSQNVSSWHTLLKTIGQKKAKDYRHSEIVLSNNLRSVEINVQAKPNESVLCTQVSQERDNLRKHQQVKINGVKIRSHAHWLQNGDRGSTFFFNLLKKKEDNECIDRILVDKKEVTDINGIKDVFLKIYSTLFSLEDSEDSKTLINSYKHLIPNRISRYDGEVLNKEISIEEVEKSIKSLKNDKAHGPDGPPIEFYKVNSDWTCKDLYDIYSEAYTKGTLGNFINRGIIKLIPKEGDKSLLQKLEADYSP